MGMFDDPLIFSEHFQEGQEFRLEAAKEGNALQTDYGEGTPSLLKIDGKWYSIFGVGIANQIDRMEPNDLPATVKVGREATKSGQEVKLLQLVSLGK